MIRIANTDDLKQYVLAAKSFYESTGRTGFNEDTFVKSWTRVIGLGAGFVIGRFTHGGPPFEAIGVLLYQDPFEGTSCASTGFWYVNGNNNGLADGLLFVALMEELVRRNVDHFYFAVLHNERMHKVTTFLDKSGFVAVETNYRKDL